MADGLRSRNRFIAAGLAIAGPLDDRGLRVGHEAGIRGFSFGADSLSGRILCRGTFALIMLRWLVGTPASPTIRGRRPLLVPVGPSRTGKTVRPSGAAGAVIETGLGDITNNGSGLSHA